MTGDARQRTTLSPEARAGLRAGLKAAVPMSVASGVVVVRALQQAGVR